MAHFIETDPQTLPENFIRRIREEWALAAATAGGRTNAMTVSWGGIGCLWNQPVAFLFVRPQRYTYQFTEAAESFSLSFRSLLNSFHYLIIYLYLYIIAASEVKLIIPANRS